MKFLLILLAIVYTTQAQIGGWKPWLESAITDDAVLDIARWSTNNLGQSLNIQGTYNFLEVRSIQKQVVAGVNYKLTIGVFLHTLINEHNDYNVSFIYIIVK